MVHGIHVVHWLVFVDRPDLRGYGRRHAQRIARGPHDQRKVGKLAAGREEHLGPRRAIQAQLARVGDHPESRRAARRSDHHRQPLRIAKGHGAQQHGVQDGKDGGVGSDAQREGDGRRQGEAGILTQDSESVSHEECSFQRVLQDPRTVENPP
jgi:hypothetical protein